MNQKPKNNIKNSAFQIKIDLNKIMLYYSEKEKIL